MSLFLSRSAFTRKSFRPQKSTHIRVNRRYSRSVVSNYSNSKQNWSTTLQSFSQCNRIVSSKRFRQVRCYAEGQKHELSLKIGIESIHSGEVGSIFFSEGDFVNMDDKIMEFETDKVAIPINAPVSGVIEKILVEEGDEVNEGTVAVILTEKEGSVEAPKAEEKKEEPKVEEKKEEPKKTQAKPQKTQEKKPAEVQHAAQTAATFERKEWQEKTPKIRRTIAKRLKDSQNTAALLTTYQDVDMFALKEMRQKHKDEFFDRHGVKLGFMSAFVKASSIALAKYPLVNAVLTDDNEGILHRNYQDISVAIASPKGLVVPVLRNVQDMTFANVEQQIMDYAKQAKNGTLALEDMQGGTFTISNGGVYGSLMGMPIINPPQSAILGMHAIFDTPWVVDGQITIRPIMKIALTYDHRLIDGREAVLFLRTIKECIEDPNKILLDL